MPGPGCGYDLRAATTDVCSECGLKVDPAVLRESGFPWAHRRKIGRDKASLLTLWLVTIGSKKMAYEAAKRFPASFTVCTVMVSPVSSTHSSIMLCVWPGHPL